MIIIQNGHRSNFYYFNELRKLSEEIKMMSTSKIAEMVNGVVPKTKTKKVRYTVLNNSHVYVVLEHATGIVDAKVHGVYSSKQSAEGKKKALTEPKTKKDGTVVEAPAKGYVCILTEHIHGAKVKHVSSSQGKIIIVS